MNRSVSKMLREFRNHWTNYVVQSLLAALVVFLLLWLLHAENLIIVASVGSTAFIVFAMPKSLTARPRNVVGGQLTGLACGALAASLAGCGAIPSAAWAQAGVYSLGVGLSIFLMVVLDTEHPPASGTALGVAIRGISMRSGLAVVLGAIILAIVHHLIKPRLRDLA